MGGVDSLIGIFFDFKSILFRESSTLPTGIITQRLLKAYALPILGIWLAEASPSLIRPLIERTGFPA